MAAFDDTALSKLTEKIDQKLSEKKQGPKKKQPQQNTQSPKAKQPQQNQQPPKTKQPQQNNQSPQDKPNLKRKRPDDKTEHAAKKRQDQPKRDFKDRSDRKSKNTDEKAPKPSQNGASSSNVLLDEIKALGGDEHDLELVGDIDSDDENLGGDGNSNKLDKALQAELAKFASGLGFEKVQPEEAEEDDDAAEEAEQEEDEDREEASEDGAAAGSQVMEKDKKAAQSVPRGDWKSVSKPHHITML
jgi:ribosome biogenesis protein MAK21